MIEIRNTSGEPILISRARPGSQYGDENVDSVEILHGETYALDGYDPEHARFVIRPVRNPHISRDYRPKVREG